MTLVLEITPQLEARLRKRAAQEGRDEAEVARIAVETYLESTDTAASKTVGAKILSELEEEGVLGLWQDRPEDSIELARELRSLAESRGSGA